MIALIRALWAEALKTKRTLAFWLALVAPLLVVGLNTLIYCQRGGFPVQEGQTAWMWYAQMTFVFWSLLMLPLFVTLETALLAGLEHRNDHWKHLFALPVPRWTVYATKQVAGMALIGLSMLALAGFVVVSGLGLRAFRPGLGFEATVPGLQIFGFAIFIYLSSWLIIALHTWVSLRWQSFVVAVGFGIAMTVAGMVVINSDWASFYPWVLPGLIANNYKDGTVLVAELVVGCLGGPLVAALGCWAFTRRDVL